MTSRRMRRAAVRPARLGLDALLSTVRYTLEGEADGRALMQSGEPAVLVLWHGRLVPLAHFHRGRGYATLISRSADGEAIAQVAEGWDYEVVRGSSSRGGSAGLRQLVRHLRAGRPVGLTPDGPRGPAQQMKHGPLVAAQLAGVPVLPVTAAADRAWWFGTWDRFLVPQPFARVLIRYGEPMDVPRTATGPELEGIASQVGRVLNELTAQADVDAIR